MFLDNPIVFTHKIFNDSLIFQVVETSFIYSFSYCQIFSLLLFAVRDNMYLFTAFIFVMAILLPSVMIYTLSEHMSHEHILVNSTESVSVVHMAESCYLILGHHAVYLLFTSLLNKV